MARYPVEAFIIGSTNFGDVDKMVTLFTRERGRVKAAAFGARRPRSPLAAGLQIFQRVELELQEGKKVDAVKSCTIKQRYPKLAEDFLVMAYGAFLAELVQEFLPENLPEEAVFELLAKAFQAFEVRNPRVLSLIFAYQLLEQTGMQLSFERCISCGAKIVGAARFSVAEGGIVCKDCEVEGAEPFSEELRQVVLAFLDFQWGEAERLRLRGGEVLAAEKLVLVYIQQLLGRPLKSLEFIRQLK